MIALLPSREVALAAFGFELRWYGVLYVAAFVLAAVLLPRLQHYRGIALSFDGWLQVLVWGMGGVLVGGRLGYAIFYEPAYFAAHPLQIFALWDGGMASHGGFIGVGVALWLVSRQLKLSLFRVADLIVIPVALGLALGRVGNFVNGELYVSAVAHLAAIVKNVLVAGACYWQLRFFPRARPGYTVALFLILYSVLRFLTEYVRVHDAPFVLGLSRGQLLTLPIAAVGVLLVLWLRDSRQQSH